MIGSGFDLLTSAPLLTLAPGTLIMLTVLAVNVVGDALRDALDPRSKARIEVHSGLAAAETQGGVAP
jgi:peptide/nickel transport system permease protein